MTSLIGGSASERIRIEKEMNLAAMQTDAIDGDDSGIKSTRKFPVMYNAWPPLFIEKDIVEYEICLAEKASAGDFIVTNKNGIPIVARLVDWKFKEGRLQLYVVDDPDTMKPRLLEHGCFVGIVLNVRRKGKTDAMFPNSRNWVEDLWGSLTKFGTVGFFESLGSMLSDWLVVLTPKPKEKPPEATFSEALASVTKWHKEAEKEESRKERLKAAKDEIKRQQILKARKEMLNVRPSSWWKEQ